MGSGLQNSDWKDCVVTRVPLSMVSKSWDRAATFRWPGSMDLDWPGGTQMNGLSKIWDDTMPWSRPAAVIRSVRHWRTSSVRTFAAKTHRRMSRSFREPYNWDSHLVTSGQSALAPNCAMARLHRATFWGIEDCRYRLASSSCVPTCHAIRCTGALSS